MNNITISVTFGDLNPNNLRPASKSPEEFRDNIYRLQNTMIEMTDNHVILSAIVGAVLVIGTMASCDVQNNFDRWDARARMVEAGANPLDIKCMTSSSDVCNLRIAK